MSTFPLLPMDIHSHSEHSPDAGVPVPAMCAAAIGKGVGVYAITDHYDISGAGDDYSARDAALGQSAADILAAKQSCRGYLRLLLGVELGQPLDDPAKAGEILDAFPFDFVLGSLHNAPGRQDIYYYDPGAGRRLLDKELELYFLSLLDLVRWGGFDSAAHLTYPFRYILARQKDYPFGLWDDHLEAVVKALAEKGLAMELNTSGVPRSPSHTMPEARWVKRFKELGGEKLTLGSDAHTPQAIGGGIPEGLRIAAEAGFTRLCYFVGRKPQYLRIDR